MEEIQNQERQKMHDAKVAKWRELHRECRNSGLSVTKWCKQKGLNRKSYYRWLKEVQKESANTTGELMKTSEIEFFEIPKIHIDAPESKGVEIVIQNRGWRIEVNNGADPEIVGKIIEKVALYV